MSTPYQIAYRDPAADPKEGVRGRGKSAPQLHVDYLPGTPEAYGAMITHAKTAPPQISSIDIWASLPPPSLLPN